MSAMSAGDLAIAGPYLLQRDGGAGRLRLGTHQSTGEEVAVKALRRRDLAVDGDLRRSVERELGALQLLIHPNIVRLLDVIHTPDHICLVLENVPADNLRPAVEGQRLPETTAFRHFYGVLAAVEYCHRCGLCHRNVCADNVLVDAAGQVRLTGFGLAALISSVGREDPPAASGLSPLYTSPEVLLGLPSDGAKGDLWSCGVLCFGLLSGRLPFRDEDPHALISKVCAVQYDVPLDHTVDQAHFISRMLTANTSQRATPAQLRQHAWWMAMCIQAGLDPDGPAHTCLVTVTTPALFPAPLPVADADGASSDPLLAITSFDGCGTEEVPVAPTVTLRSAEGTSDADRSCSDPAEQATSSNCTPNLKGTPGSSLCAPPHQEETFSEAVAKIMGDALNGLDEVEDPVELRRRLQKLIHEFKHVRAYADTLHQQVVASSEAIRTLSGSPSPKRVCWVPDPVGGPEEDIAQDILTVFIEWGWSEDEARSRIQSPEHTLEKAVYHLLQIYLKGGATVPKPDFPKALSRNDAARQLLHQLLALQSAHIRNNKSHSEPTLVRPSMGPAWPAVRQFSEGALVVRPQPEQAEKPKKKGFSWARLFRWRASSVRQLSPEEKAKEKDEEGDKDKGKDKKDKGKGKGKEKQATPSQGTGKVKGFLQ